jgi:hypothetical protein
MFPLAILTGILAFSCLGQSKSTLQDTASNSDSDRAAYLTRRLVSLFDKFRYGTSVQRQTALEQLNAIALERQQLMERMFTTQPETASRLGLSAHATAGLPKSIKVPMERPVKIRGELSVLYEDSPPRSKLQYFLKANGKQHSLHFKGEPPTQFKTGDQVTVSGLQINYQLLVDSLTSEASPTVPGPQMVSNNSFGEHKFLVILVNFQDKQTQPVTATQIRSTLTTTSDYFREASYGQTWLTSDVLGWFTMPMSSTTCDKTAISTYAQQAAVAAGANLSSYNHYVYAFPTNACAWAGVGTIGGSPSEAWLNGWFDLQEFGHELGHNFGLFHSRSMDCGAAVTGSNCTTDEYGDLLDFMGSASSAHYNLFQKERLGWVNYGSSPSLATVTANGNYWIDSYEGMSSNPKGLKILKSTDPTTGARTWYYLEHRSAYGFDSVLSGNTNVLNGVVVHQGSESSGQSIYLLDLTPSTASWNDPALTAGQSYSDSDAAVTMTVVYADSTGAMVSVSFGTPQCTSTNPTVTLSPSQGPVVAAGTLVSYTVTVTNNDSLNCGPATFNLQASVPSGWTTSFSPESISINPGTSATSQLQVTSASAATGGTYNINATASNGSFYSNTVSGTYVVTSPPSIAVSSAQTYSRNQPATTTALVSANGSPVVGATVSFTMTKSNGAVVSGSGVTGSNGAATWKYSFSRKKDPTGTYRVVATTSVNGTTISGTTSFLVK